MYQLPLLENAYFLLAVIRSYFPGFSDDGCTVSPDGLFGYDFSWACRIHDWRYCTRCHPPGSMSRLARRFADEELRMHMRASLPWYTRGWVPLVYRLVVRFFGRFGAWDSCGPEAGDLCRHQIPMPAWMLEGLERP
jgi:hypothetical protein